MIENIPQSELIDEPYLYEDNGEIKLGHNYTLLTYWTDNKVSEPFDITYS
jgi:hypothetical protein